MRGDTTLGSSGGSQHLTVNSAATFLAPATAAAFQVTGTLTATGKTVIGSSGSTTLTINSATLCSAPVTLSSNLNLPRGSRLNVSGDAILGRSSRDRIVIHGATAFTAAVAFEGGVTFPNTTQGLSSSGDTTLGSGPADLLTVKADATFTAAVQIDDQLSILSLLSVEGDAVLGNSSSNHLAVPATATFTGPLNVYGSSTSLSQSAVLRFQRKLGNAAVATGAALGALLFTAWDGASDGASAQIRSVYTVSWIADNLMNLCDNSLALHDCSAAAACEQQPPMRSVLDAKHVEGTQYCQWDCKL